MKTVMTRIEEGQARALDDIACQIKGYSRDSLVRRAVKVWLRIEGPVLLAGYPELLDDIEELEEIAERVEEFKRQPVEEQSRNSQASRPDKLPEMDRGQNHNNRQAS